LRFWDASALVPLIIEEPASSACRDWIKQDPEVVLWGLTWLEVASAVERRVRDGRMSKSVRGAALARIRRIVGDAHEISDLPAVRTRALLLVARHALPSADAAQLGAALLAADPDPGSLTMVVLDHRLADAAEREGLAVLTWPGSIQGP
jgi:uncharacterized protein